MLDGPSSLASSESAVNLLLTFLRTALLCLGLAVLCGGDCARGEETDIFAAPIVGGAAQWVVLVNDRVGWRPFAEAGFLGSSTVVGNIEAGHVWSGHSAFARPPEATSGFTIYPNSSALNELDWHATMVVNVLAGSGFDGTNYSLVGLGMAPEAAVLSGSVATEFSPDVLGAFETTYRSVLTPYRAFMTGDGVPRADVINSSWSGYGPSATNAEVVALDGLAAQNPFSALVASAGNATNQPAGWPGSGFNLITVGALSGKTFLEPAAFSSRGLADFYNPQTGITIPQARVAVDLAAPGDDLFLAAYLGNQGGLAAALPGLVQDPPPDDLYFINVGGTSFASPLVAGGLAILKDVANRDPVLGLGGLVSAQDTRVAKSVLMAGALETYGWDNGQAMGPGGEMVTTMALDRATGAGAMDMVRSGEAYFSGTRDVAGTSGGVIDRKGWDFGTLTLGGVNEYTFGDIFTQPVELTVSLNWFAGRSFDMDDDLGRNLSFADLNLEVYEFGGGETSTLLGRSATVYNNSEFLRLELSGGKSYGLRVHFDQMVFDTSPGLISESYGLAWLVSSYATNYWNPAGTNQVWNGLAANWSSEADGGEGQTKAVSTLLDQLVWGAGTNPAVTVTVEGAQLARAMTFNGPTFLSGPEGASINLRNGGLTAAESMGAETRLGPTVALLLSGDQSWRNASAHALVVEGAVRGKADTTWQANSSGSITIGGEFAVDGFMTNAGSGLGEVLIAGNLGAEVRGITQSSQSSKLVIGGEGIHRFAGETLVSQGELVVDGDLSLSLRTTVLAGATLSGAGILSSATIFGTHRPGHSPGLQTFTGDVSYGSSAGLVWELVENTANGAGMNFDSVTVGGNLAFEGRTSFQLVFNLPESEVLWSDPFWNSDRSGEAGWLIYRVTGTTSSLSNLQITIDDWVDSQGELFSLLRERGSFDLASVGPDVYLTYAVVPEPSVWWLLVMAGAVLCSSRSVVTAYRRGSSVSRRRSPR